MLGRSTAHESLAPLGGCSSDDATGSRELDGVIKNHQHSMYVSMYMYTYIYICVSIHVWYYVYRPVYTVYICVYVYIYIYIQAYAYAYLYPDSWIFSVYNWSFSSAWPWYVCSMASASARVWGTTTWWLRHWSLEWSPVICRQKGGPRRSQGIRFLMWLSCGMIIRPKMHMDLCHGWSSCSSPNQ